MWKYGSFSDGEDESLSVITQAFVRDPADVRMHVCAYVKVHVFVGYMSMDRDSIMLANIGRRWNLHLRLWVHEIEHGRDSYCT
jgi:hypothetical protein